MKIYKCTEHQYVVRAAYNLGQVRQFISALAVTERSCWEHDMHQTTPTAQLLTTVNTDDDVDDDQCAWL
eukprot:3668641-Pleurochrysis_carterae.AAC.1